MLSKLVRPVKAYTNADPNKINPDDRPPRRKYFSPAEVADSESRYNVARIYTANDCNSILKYRDTRSPLEIKKLEPHVVNRIIKGYSKIVGTAVNTDRACAITFVVTGAQGSKITAPTRKMNVSTDCDTDVTWNRPL
jgi:hypothetical protein